MQKDQPVAFLIRSKLGKTKSSKHRDMPIDAGVDLPSAWLNAIKEGRPKTGAS
jgi:hypothetical protein